MIRVARAVWTGVISFGLVAVPVGLFSATEDHGPRFRQFARGTADRIRYRRINERTGREVDYDDIVKGGGGKKATPKKSSPKKRSPRKTAKKAS